MKREGFISVIALMLMTLILATCTYVSYAVTVQSHITSNNQKHIQSRISSEDKSNRLLYDREIFDEVITPEIYKVLRNKKPPYMEKDIDGDGIPDGVSLSIPKNSNLASNIISTNMRLQGSNEVLMMNPIPYNFEERTTMIIRMITEYEGIQNMVEVKSEIINKIFEIEEPFIEESMMIEHNLIEKFNDFILLIEEEIFDFDPKPPAYYLRVNLEGDGYINENYIKGITDNSNRTYEHRTKLMSINIKASDDYRPTIEIRDDNNNNNKVHIKGNIYCEGDLIISSPFELDGNLIINKGSLIVNSEFKPIVRGKVIYSGSGLFDPDHISIETNKRLVYLYGSYLPGFLDMNIDVIKNK